MIPARALICTEDQSFSLETVTLPETGPDQIRVRTLVSGVSPGTELALIRNKISWGPYPLCTGYQAVGIVEEVGANVSDFAVGDKVYYRAGSGITIGEGQAVTCAQGTHCSAAVLHPGGNHGAAKVPDGVSDECAAMFVLPSVGLNGVKMSEIRKDDVVLVIGCGPIGLGVVNAAALRGATVIATDINPAPLALAKTLGASEIVLTAGGNAVETLLKSLPDGADAVFECTGIPKVLETSHLFCKTGGKLILQGNYGNGPLPFPFMELHMRQLRLFFPCDDGYQPCREEVLNNMASGDLPWGETISHRVSCNDAAAWYDELNKGSLTDLTGAVILWEDT